MTRKVIDPFRDAKARKEPKRPPPTRYELWAWSLVGATALLLTVAGIFALKVEDNEDRMRRLSITVDPSDNMRLPYEGGFKKDYERYKREGELYEKLTWTFAGLSAAAVVGATVLFTLDHLKRRKEKAASSRALRLVPLMTPTGAGLSLGAEF